MKTTALLSLTVGCCVCLGPLRAADPVVSNVRATQRPGTQLVDIIYDVTDPDSGTLAVSVAVSDTGGATYAVPASTFTGDVGNAVTPGMNKRITWDAGRDWPGKFSANMRFRVMAQDVPPAPPGMVLIPAGSFQMGDTIGDGHSDERPVHTVTLSAFYMDRTEVSTGLWDEVYQWAVRHGYTFQVGVGKDRSHPVWVNWFDAAKWCNARSEKEGRIPAYYTSPAQTEVCREGEVTVFNNEVKWNGGYRLPTEAEWEYAARGGRRGNRFPWGNTISHSQANYNSRWWSGWGELRPIYSYDVSPTMGFHPTYMVDGLPGDSPVESFGTNGYGLFNMAGNMREWCWDWWYWSYESGAQTNPRGPANPIVDGRVIRGGSADDDASSCRVAARFSFYPNDFGYAGFRCVLAPSQ